MNEPLTATEAAFERDNPGMRAVRAPEPAGTVNAERITQVKTVMSKISDDAQSDAITRDGQPLTGQVMGSMHGVTMAMIAALADAVHLLANEVSSLGAASDDLRTALVTVSTLLEAMPGE